MTKFFGAFMYMFGCALGYVGITSGNLEVGCELFAAGVVCCIIGWVICPELFKE